MKSTPLFVRQDIGAGQPIVLLHGLFADGTQWERIAKLLSQDFRVIVVDLLGHGRSPRPKNSNYSAKEHVDALRSALKKIDVVDNITIVGYSMGGSVALSYAAEFPDDTLQLYLISSPFYLRPDQMIAANYASSVLVTKASQTLYKTVEKLLGSGRMLSRIVGRADHSETFHKLIGANDNVLDSKIIKLNIKSLVREFDFAKTLSNVKVPITFYAGKKDPFIVQGQLYALKKFSPYMDIRRLDIIKMDHMLVQNLPKEITKLLSANKSHLLNVGYDVGKGDVLILLHGIESSSTYWKNLVKPLAEHRRVIAIDLLGFGKSPKPTNIGYTIQDHVSALHLTLESLGIKKVSIAGHSMGGVIAMAYAGTYPKNIKRLTLFSPVLLPKNTQSSQLVLKTLQKLDYLPDIKLLYQQVARYVGEDRLREYEPAARSIENTVNKQEAVKYAKNAKAVKTELYYGALDPLIDKRFINTVANRYTDCSVKELKNKNHNFVIFNPEVVLQALDGQTKHKYRPAKSSISHKTFVQQIARLAVPLLFLKSVFFLSVGLLLFSNYAAATLVIGLAVYVVIKGFKVIRGAFSLRYEGISYIAYVLLGIATVLIGYALLKHPQGSLEFSVYMICCLIALVGATRVVVAIVWTQSKLLTRSLLLTGIPMTLAGLIALGGGMTSIYIIIYTIAAVIMARGILYGWYCVISIIVAYMRGFNSHYTGKSNFSTKNFTHKI